MREWEVYKPDHEDGWRDDLMLFDCVYYDDNMTAPEVYKDLLEHRGFPSDIKLRWLTTMADSDFLTENFYPDEHYEPGDEYDEEMEVIFHRRSYTRKR